MTSTICLMTALLGGSAWAQDDAEVERIVRRVMEELRKERGGFKPILRQPFKLRVEDMRGRAAREHKDCHAKCKCCKRDKHVRIIRRHSPRHSPRHIRIEGTGGSALKLEGPAHVRIVKLGRDDR